MYSPHAQQGQIQSLGRGGGGGGADKGEGSGGGCAPSRAKCRRKKFFQKNGPWIYFQEVTSLKNV